jgi:hypothetical protein
MHHGAIFPFPKKKAKCSAPADATLEAEAI